MASIFSTLEWLTAIQTHAYFKLWCLGLCVEQGGAQLVQLYTCYGLGHEHNSVRVIIVIHGKKLKLLGAAPRSWKYVLSWPIGPHSAASQYSRGAWKMTDMNGGALRNTTAFFWSRCSEFITMRWRWQKIDRAPGEWTRRDVKNAFFARCIKCSCVCFELPLDIIGGVGIIRVIWRRCENWHHREQPSVKKSTNVIHLPPCATFFHWLRPAEKPRRSHAVSLLRLENKRSGQLLLALLLPPHNCKKILVYSSVSCK